MTPSREPITAYRLAITKLEVSIKKGTTKPFVPRPCCHQLGQGLGAGPHTHWKVRVMIGAVGL